MAEEVRVDLDELEKTVAALNQVLSGLGKAGTDTATNTYLPPGALGTGFDEADKLMRRAQRDQDVHRGRGEVPQHRHGRVRAEGEVHARGVPGHRLRDPGELPERGTVGVMDGDGVRAEMRGNEGAQGHG